jgi:hypothetical protein
MSVSRLVFIFGAQDWLPSYPKSGIPGKAGRVCGVKLLGGERHPRAVRPLSKLAYLLQSYCFDPRSANYSRVGHVALHGSRQPFEYVRGDELHIGFSEIIHPVPLSNGEPSFVHSLPNGCGLSGRGSLPHQQGLVRTSSFSPAFVAESPVRSSEWLGAAPPLKDD